MSLRCPLKAAGEDPLVITNSVNPSAFAGRFLHHLVLFSSPRCRQSLERGLGWPGSLALIGMWHGANVWGDYLRGFRETRAQLWSSEWCWSLSTLNTIQYMAEHSFMLYVCKMEAFVFLFVRWTTSPLLSSHNSAGLTHIGLSVGTLGRRKLSANQVAPGRKSSFHGCVIVFHSVPNTGAFHYRNCLIPVKDFDKDSMFIFFNNNKGCLWISAGKMNKENNCCLRIDFGLEHASPSKWQETYTGVIQRSFYFIYSCAHLGYY